MITLTIVIIILYIYSIINIRINSKNVYRTFDPFEGSYPIYMIFCLGTTFILGLSIYLLTKYAP